MEGGQRLTTGSRMMVVLGICSMIVVACNGSADLPAAEGSQPPLTTGSTETTLQPHSTETTLQPESTESPLETTPEVAVSTSTTAPPATVEPSTTAPIPAAQPTRDGAALIDLNARRQSIDGFGVSTRVWSDPHLSNAPQTNVPAAAQDEILTLLIDDLGLTRMRPIIEGGIEVENDNDDSNVLDPAGFNFEWKRTDAHIDFVGQARERDLSVWFPTMLKPEQWMTEEEPDEFVERIMAQLFRWQERGALPPFVSPVNEPGFTRAGEFSRDWFVAVVRELGRRIDEAGLDTKLVIPDDLNPSTGIRFVEAVLADPEARQYVDVLAYHLYGGDQAARLRFVELSEELGVPVWMTEFSRPNWGTWPAVLDWAATVHELLVENSASAVDYMWGFFGSYQEGHALVSIEFDDGQYQSHEPLAAYWVTGQWSRFVRPGYVRTDVTAPPGAELSAFVAPNGSEVVIVVVNRSEQAVALPIEVAGGLIDGAIRRVRSSATEQWSESSIEPAGTQGFEAELAPQSVTTFVVPIGQ